MGDGQGDLNVERMDVLRSRLYVLFVRRYRIIMQVQDEERNSTTKKTCRRRDRAGNWLDSMFSLAMVSIQVSSLHQFQDGGKGQWAECPLFHLRKWLNIKVIIGYNAGLGITLF